MVYILGSVLYLVSVAHAGEKTMSWEEGNRTLAQEEANSADHDADPLSEDQAMMKLLEAWRPYTW